MEKKILSLVLTVFLVLALSSVCAIDVDRQQLLTFGHILYVNNVTVTPESIVPGSSGVISFDIENTGTNNLSDLIITMSLPTQISNYNDLNNKKIAFLDSGKSTNVRFQFIVSPSTEEGIYGIPISLRYINHIGDQRIDNETVTIIVKNTPNLLTEVQSSEVYKGNDLGNVAIKIINGNIGNVKFLNAQLKDSNNYRIISSSNQYLGDLNSDDFSVANFKIEAKSTSKDIILPLTLTYKDALNKDYTQNVNVTLKMLSASQMGIKKSYGGIIFIIIIVAIAGYIFYRRYKNNLLKNKKAKLILRKDSIFRS